MEKRTKFSIWFYVFTFLSILVLDSMLFSGLQVKEISYKEFRDRLEQNKIESVIIKPDKIIGLMKAPDSSKTLDSLKQADTSANNIKKKKTFVERFLGLFELPDTTKNKSKKSKGFEPARKQTPWRLRFAEQQKELQRQFFVIPLNDDKLLEDLQRHGVDYRGKLESNWLRNMFLNWIIPLGLLFVIWGFVFRKMGGGMGALSVGKNKAKIYAEDPKNRVTFHDVAGIDEAVEEVNEIVEFLRNPTKFTRLGAKLPKGILLVGPPGTGKTLLAKAVAGEAGVPFFSMSGSDFVEMFVGVGAARVRDLFSAAKAKAPCIIFIDEIDAIGKSRGRGVFTGGFDERENTLNQLLVEMDGFDPGLGIIIMGATNRADVLDPALLRPGRFDRQVLVDRPDLQGRMDIFKVHTRKLTLDSEIDLRNLAALTPGFAGAEIANVCNEAALLASRKERNVIKMEDFHEAIERVIAGLEKKNKLINPRERKTVAYHESGHAIVGHFTPGADPVQKVSIVPRGLGALGYTIQTPLEDRYLMSRSELIGKIKGLLGGRASEEVVFGEISTGASNDLEKAAKIARDMIKMYGMSKRLPNISFVEQNQGGFLGQEPNIAHHSEKVDQMIDEEVLEIINTSFEEAKKLLEEKRDKLDKMAQTLLEKEVIEEKEVVEILGPRPDENKGK